MAKSSKEVLFYGGLDTDTVSSLLADGDYRSAHYARGGNASESDALSLTSMLGNLLVENTDLPSGVNTVIGSAVWVEGDSILFFVHNSGGAHSIFQYEITTQNFTLVIESEVLNFQLGNKIYDSRIANGILYWTDGYFESYLEDNGIVQFNPPRMLNIAHAIAGYGSINLQTFDVIKAPPASLTSLTYTDDAANTSNKLYGGVYQFTVQWVYENDEETVWSPISELLVPTKQEFTILSWSYRRVLR